MSFRNMLHSFVSSRAGCSFLAGGKVTQTSQIQDLGRCLNCFRPSLIRFLGRNRVSVGFNTSYSLMAKTFSTVAQRRIQSELNEWMRSPPEGCGLESCEPMTSWVVLMQGPEGQGRLYADEVFRVKIDFAEQYPLDPPDFVFLAPAPIHPHIYSNGHICLDILYSGHNGGWSPALTMSKVVLSLRSMLASATEKRKPPGDAEYCARVGNRSPKLSNWVFEDDKV